MFEQVSHSKDALLHVLNELKTGYDMRPQSFLGSFGRTAHDALQVLRSKMQKKSFKNATDSSTITGFLKTDPDATRMSFWDLDSVF